MFPDLFSSFDPGMSNSYQFSPFLFWAVTYSISFFIVPFRFIESTRLKIAIGLVVSLSINLVKNTKTQKVPGFAWLMTCVFFMILSLNLVGLFPWAASITSHVVFSLSLTLPVWMLTMITTTANAPFKKVSSLVGKGLPNGLASIIGLIETASLIIRPLTLSLRLVANMMAGHIIMALLMSALLNPSGLMMFLTMSILVIGIYLFELAVCVVQAYVFILLLSIYVTEWVSKH